MKKTKNDNYKISKKDFIVALIIMLLYAFVSFYKLGNMKSPNTFYNNKKNNTIIVDLHGSQFINTIKIFNGVRASDYTIYISEDGNEYDYLRSISKNTVFSWDILPVTCKTRYLKIDFLGETSVGEIGLYNNNSKLISGTYYNSKFDRITSLNDEKELLPKAKSYMNSTYFDEIYFARTAYEYVYNLKIYEWTHPPLGKIIQAIPIYITHYMSPFNYRLMGNISGILLVGVMYFFGVILFKKKRYGIISSLLMCLDTFHFAHTRMGTVDSHLVLFITLSILFMYIFTTNNKIRYLLLSGIFFSLSISVKWTGLYSGIVLAIIYFIYLFKNKQINIKFVCLGSTFFVLIPIIIYLTIFIIFSNNYYKTNNISNIIKENQLMYNYHSKLNAKHNYSSSWYTWPISYKPVMYHNIKYINGVENISGVGNLIIWIGGFIGLIYCIIKFIKKKDKIALLLIICSLGLWLPYMFIGRIMFLYHYFPVLPFIFLSLVYLINDIDNHFNIKYSFVPIIIFSYIFFVIYYPAVSGSVTNNNYHNYVELFDSWHFT